MEPPVKPEESDCCNSGCNPCILDIYEKELRKFKEAKKFTGNPKDKNCLSPTSFSVFRLENICSHSKDCNLYTFRYVRQEKLMKTEAKKSIFYEPGQYLLLKGTLNGETFQKAYTPLYQKNLASDQFTIMVKLYENGRMSRLFQRMTLGTETLWRGPYGDSQRNYSFENILFIAQGTGVAPFYTIICDMLDNDQCYTFLTLFLCCNINNLLLCNELYHLQDFWNFKYELFLSGHPENDFNTKYNETVHFTRLRKENIENYLRNLKTRTFKVFICGSEGFCEEIKKLCLECDICIEDIKLF